jgi:hypothetical protein
MKENQLDATVYIFILADGDALHVSGVFALTMGEHARNM